MLTVSPPDPFIVVVLLKMLLPSVYGYGIGWTGSFLFYRKRDKELFCGSKDTLRFRTIICVSLLFPIFPLLLLIPSFRRAALYPKVFK